MQTNESWWGNLTAGGVLVSLGQQWGINGVQDILTIVLTVTTIGWTLEKWRCDRVRRSGYEQSIGAAKKSRLGSLWDAMKSKPAELDTDQDASWQEQEDVHRGKP